MNGASLAKVPSLDESMSFHSTELSISCRSQQSFLKESQRAVEMIAASSPQNCDAMDLYLAGGTGLGLWFEAIKNIDLLAHFLHGNESVETLVLNGPIVTQQGLASVLQSLLYNKSLRELDIYDVPLSRNVLTTLAALLRDGGSGINTLRLVHKGMHSNGISVICHALAGNTVLTKLELNGLGFLEKEDTLNLGRMMEATTSLTELSLFNSSIGNVEAIVLSASLKKNTSLLLMALSGCGIGDKGILAIAEALKENKTLLRLDMSRNSLTTVGWNALAEALRFNRSLIMLNIGEDHDELAGAIGRAFCPILLKENVCLTELHSNSISDERIQNLLARNQDRIPEAARRAALLLIGIRQSTDFEAMGDFAIFPKDIVKLIAQAVYATRKDPIWIQALE